MAPLALFIPLPPSCKVVILWACVASEQILILQHLVSLCCRFMSVNELGHKKPRRLPNSFFGWIFPVYSASEEEIIEVAGKCAHRFRFTVFNVMKVV